MSRLDGILSLHDFEEVARRHLPRSVMAFVQSGVEAEIALRDNRAVFDDWHIVPRVLVGVDKRSQAATVFGHDYASPFGVAPMGMESLVGYRSDLVLAAEAHRANIPFILSGASLIRMEDIIAAHPGAWFQAYLPLEFARTEGLMDRAAACGYRTLVVTVDMTAGSNRENTRRAGFHAPIRPGPRMVWEGITHPAWTFGTFLRTILTHGMPHFENIDAGRGAPIVSSNAIRDTSGRAGHDWDVFRAIRRHWKGNLVIKGLLDPGDARIAAEAGADGIIVSTHGGRQMDGVLPALSALPAMVAAAPGATVMIDSGFRRGTDILKAFALGAKFVFVGRPFNYAAILGAEGVRHAFGLLRAEVSRDLGNLGANSLAEVTRDRLVARRER